jgi:hypothetical protein
MPALSASRLAQAIVTALNESDASSVVISSARAHPKRFAIQYARNIFELWVYIWTLTHGGGSARPRHEYRIQLTGVSPPLSLNPEGPTILVGYEPNLNCYAGFDVSKHQTFSENSPSIQIPITVLHEALQNGFSFVTKGNDEIAVGIRPDQFLAYCTNAELLHRHGADASEVENGLCLSPTYHRAFDRALIYLDESLRMQINPAKERELTALQLHGGLADFKSHLGTRIHLPADRIQWPDLRLIKAANALRQINQP